MEAILDTNFIISCLMKKIDFLSELDALGFKPIVPREVLQEMKDLRISNKTSRLEKEAINLALEIVEKEKIRKMSLGQGVVDDALISRGKAGIFIATLDRGIKNKVPNRIVISGAQKKLQIERS